MQSHASHHDASPAMNQHRSSNLLWISLELPLVLHRDYDADYVRVEVGVCFYILLLAIKIGLQTLSTHYSPSLSCRLIVGPPQYPYLSSKHHCNSFNCHTSIGGCSWVLKAVNAGIKRRVPWKCLCASILFASMKVVAAGGPR
jgi:hypothetical protein